MKGKCFIVLLLAALLCACQEAPVVDVKVRECAPMPCGGRANAGVCVSNGKAYVFAGRKNDRDYLNDLWQYDPTTDCWTDLGETPMKSRVNAIIASHGDKLYMGLGYSELMAYIDTAYMYDWWEYTPSTNEWKRLADYPGRYPVAALSFELNHQIYAIYGTGIPGFSNEVAVYDIASDSWELKPKNKRRPTANSGCRGAWSGGMYYYGTGYNTYNLTTWYVTDIISDEWKRCASIPGKGREFCACAANKTYVYLFGGQYFGGDITGGWEIFDSFMRYDPQHNQWAWCGQMPCGKAVNQLAFCIDGKVYFGFGEDDKRHIINKLYCIEE